MIKKLASFTYFLSRMKIYTEFNLAPWLKMVQFVVLNIEGFWFLISIVILALIEIERQPLWSISFSSLLSECSQLLDSTTTHLCFLSFDLKDLLAMIYLRPEPIPDWANFVVSSREAKRVYWVGCMATSMNLLRIMTFCTYCGLPTLEMICPSDFRMVAVHNTHKRSMTMMLVVIFSSHSWSMKVKLMWLA